MLSTLENTITSSTAGNVLKMNFHYCVFSVHYLMCLLAAASMFAYCSYRYIKDESTSIVDFQTYHAREEDIYPSISFCLFTDDKYTPWQNGTLPLYNGTLLDDKYSYVNFLLGNEIDSIPVASNISSFLKINYDHVTLNLTKYLKRIKIGSAGHNLFEWNDRSGTTAPIFVSYRHPLTKCYSLNLLKDVIEPIKDQILNEIQLDFYSKNSLFGKDSETDIGIYLHYPNQLMRAKDLLIDHLGKSFKTIVFAFSVDDLKVIRRRNTRFKPCNVVFEEDDDAIRRQLIQNTGCTPSYWLPSLRYPQCTTPKQLLDVLTPSLRGLNSSFLKKFDPPCNQIQTISYTTKLIKRKHVREKLCKENGKLLLANVENKDEQNVAELKIPPGQGNNWADREKESICNSETRTIEIIFKNPYYEEVQHVKSFNFESWIGNAGGYVGLFLGFAIWQIPVLIEFLSTKISDLLYIDVFT